MLIGVLVLVLMFMFMLMLMFVFVFVSMFFIRRRIRLSLTAGRKVAGCRQHQQKTIAASHGDQRAKIEARWEETFLNHAAMPFQLGVGNVDSILDLIMDRFERSKR